MATATIGPEQGALFEAERSALARIDGLLQQASGALALAGVSDEPVPLPDALVAALRQIVSLLAHDRAVMIIPTDAPLTTQQAADLLTISRPSLIRLLDQGAMPFTRAGTHRRIRLVDVLVYKRQRDADRSATLDSLTQMSQEFGLYARR